MNPEISVIVPVYNVKAYLDECLASIASQQDADFDVWMINDGSTDGSQAVLERWQAEDSRFHLVTRENGGLSAARNTGIESSRGTYIAFVDSDDIISSQYLRCLYEAVSRQSASIAVCDMEYFDETGKRTRSSGGSFQSGSVRQEPSLIGINNSACNKLFLRSLFDDIRFPERKYYEDLATVPLLLFRADKVVKVDKALYYYRQRQGSIAHKASEKIFEIYDAIDGIAAYLRKNGIAEDDPLMTEVHHLYVVHGLDLTTLRIKDFKEKDIRAGYLRKNLERLRKSCPDYERDSVYRDAPAKKKLIWTLLKHHHENAVLKLYD